MGLGDVWRRAIGRRRADSGPPASGLASRHPRPPEVDGGSGTATHRTVSVDADAVDWALWVRVTVGLRHSDPAVGSLAETQLAFSAGGPPVQEWRFMVGDNAPATYTWQATYAARDGSRVTASEVTTDADVLLLPPSAGGAGLVRTTRVVVSEVDFTVIELVVVDLRYVDHGADFTTEEHLVFSSDSSTALSWQFIGPGNGPSTYEWQATYSAKDGQRSVLQGEGTIGEVLTLPSGMG
jgi:hypothetical protein